MTSSTIYVLIVDWNGWRDTIECLESLVGVVSDNVRILVCDNASSEDSSQKIAAWAEGKLLSNHERARLPDVCWRPPGTLTTVRLVSDETLTSLNDDPQLTIIRSSQNRGFAGANNLMLRYALTKDFGYVWLLNNDTVVARKALPALLERATADPQIGMCGSKLLYYSHPELVQAYGGSHFDTWTGRGCHIGEGQQASAKVDFREVEKEMSYVVGASMLVSRRFLEEVGLMSEDYFLYFEEIDWATRGKHFKLGFAPDSIVYHKVGATIGTGKSATPHSTMAEYYATRSRLMFTTKYYKSRLPLALLALAASCATRLMRGQFENARAIQSAVRDFIAGNLGQTSAK